VYKISGWMGGLRVGSANKQLRVFVVQGPTSSCLHVGIKRQGEKKAEGAKRILLLRKRFIILRRPFGRTKIDNILGGGEAMRPFGTDNYKEKNPGQPPYLKFCQLSQVKLLMRGCAEWAMKSLRINPIQGHEFESRDTPTIEEGKK